MIATVINMIAVFLGGGIGLLLRGRLKDRLSGALVKGLGLCVLLIGLSGALETENVLCVIICMVLGIILGELLRIEERLDSLGDVLRARVMRGRETGRFTEGFVSATLLFCVGSMAIIGSMEAGIRGDYAILLSKSVIDGVMAVTFAATMGVGVLFAGLAVFAYQGILTLLAVWVGPFLPDATVTEMSAVGGLLIAALAGMAFMFIMVVMLVIATCNAGVI